MYLAYFWGCNKYKPTLAAMGSDLSRVKLTVAKKAGCESFDEIIDWTASLKDMLFFDASYAYDYIDGLDASYVESGVDVVNKRYEEIKDLSIVVPDAKKNKKDQKADDLKNALKSGIVGNLHMKQAKVAIANGKCMCGPACSLSSKGEDYSVKEGCIFKLMKALCVYAPECPCVCNVSIFYVEDTTEIEFDEIMDAMEENIC
jgi:hypothetical protein